MGKGEIGSRQLHAAFHTGTMVTEGTAEDGVKFVHSLLRWWLRSRLPLTHISVYCMNCAVNITKC